jgi:hypothetical protein
LHPNNMRRPARKDRRKNSIECCSQQSTTEVWMEKIDFTNKSQPSFCKSLFFSFADPAFQNFG